MEDWRLEQSRGSDALRAKMNQALSYARFETIAEKLLDQCLLYLPADMSNFLVEVLRKQLGPNRSLCASPAEHHERCGVWLQEQPFRELFLLLGEKYAALDPHPELLPWLIEELQKPSIEEAACRLREQNQMNSKQPAAPESAAGDDELCAFERDEAEIARRAAMEARRKPEYLQLTLHKCGTNGGGALKAAVTLAAPVQSGEAAVERETQLKDISEGQCTWDELLEFPSDSAWRDKRSGSLTVVVYDAAGEAVVEPYQISLSHLAAGPLTLELKSKGVGQIMPVAVTVNWESQEQHHSRRSQEQQLADARAAAGELDTLGGSWKKAAKMVVLFLGPPGSGKVTHGGRLSAGLGVPLVKCGEALRDAVDAGTPAGVAVAASVQSNEMVPDNLMLEVLMERIQASDCAEGLVLEGFPRNAAQIALVSTLAAELAGVVQFDASDEVLLARVAGKWIHKASGRVYHAEHKKPASIAAEDEPIAAVAENMKDDVTGDALSQKPSDEPVALKERLSRWRSAAAVVEQLDAVGNVYPIDVGGSIDSVAAAVDEVIKKIKKREAPPDRTAEKEAAAKAAAEKEAAAKAAADKAAADKAAADEAAADKAAADKAAADKAAADKAAADKAAADEAAADKAAADKAAADKAAADKAAADKAAADKAAADKAAADKAAADKAAADKVSSRQGGSRGSSRQGGSRQGSSRGSSSRRRGIPSS